MEPIYSLAMIRLGTGGTSDRPTSIHHLEKIEEDDGWSIHRVIDYRTFRSLRNTMDLTLRFWSCVERVSEALR